MNDELVQQKDAACTSVIGMARCDVSKVYAARLKRLITWHDMHLCDTAAPG